MDAIDRYIFNAGKWAGKIESLAADVERHLIDLEFHRYRSDDIEDEAERLEQDQAASKGEIREGGSDPLPEVPERDVPGVRP